MFNASDVRLRAKHPTRLDSYIKRHGFRDILQGLVADGVPEEEIMRTIRGPGGCVMLHDAFFIDFMAWIGGAPYYRAVRAYVSYPDYRNKSQGNPNAEGGSDDRIAGKPVNGKTTGTPEV